MKKPCEACVGRGWLHAYNSDTRKVEIQRCDACCRFIGDEAALDYVVSRCKEMEMLMRREEAIYAKAKGNKRKPAPVKKTRGKAETVPCSLCGRQRSIMRVHLHRGTYIGNCCWDDRLKTTE